MQLSMTRVAWDQGELVPFQKLNSVHNLVCIITYIGNDLTLLLYVLSTMDFILGNSFRGGNMVYNSSS